MAYPIDKLDHRYLMAPVSRATEAVVRLDERLARSPIGDGLRMRLDFSDAVSSLWIDGELAHLDDLVFHDARMDVRAPTHEVVMGHLILRTRRTVLSRDPNWVFSGQGLDHLRGREGLSAGNTHEQASEIRLNDADESDPEIGGQEAGDVFDSEIVAFDRVLQRSRDVLTGQRVVEGLGRPADPLAIVYDPDWNEPERIALWQDVRVAVDDLPPILAAAILLDAWIVGAVSEHSSWLGRILAAAHMRAAGLTRHHLASVSVGLRQVDRARRTSRRLNERLVAIVEGFEHAALQGLREHDRLMVARRQMERHAKDCRSTSRLPELIDLVLSRPMVSAGLVARELHMTPQGALGLLRKLRLREMTGRGRFRAWGIL